MTKATLLMTALAALVLGHGAAAQAQANCPSTDNLSFINVADGSVVSTSTLSNKTARIWLGSVAFLGGSYISTAWIWLNNGSCKAYWLSYDGVNIAPALTKNTNLCLGYLDDVVDNIAHQHPPFTCAGQTYQAYPLLQNGYRLQTYAGSGNDTLWTDSGVDRVYGGNGFDYIEDFGGMGDRIYGETHGDELMCSTGGQTLCDGGASLDEMWDLSGSNDTIYGGGWNDIISTCEVKTVDCGSGPEVDLLIHEGNALTITNCEKVRTFDHDCPP